MLKSQSSGSGLLGNAKAASKPLLFPKNVFGDAAYSIQRFVRVHGYLPRLWSPRTFNEFLLLTKIRSLSSPGLAEYTDKASVKSYIELRLGPGFVPSTFGVLRTYAEIHSFDFPCRCVVKPVHTSGDVFLRDSCQTPVPREIFTDWLSRDYYAASRERNYKYVNPAVIVEERLKFGQSAWPDDLKVFCFHGRPKFIQHDNGRFGDHMRSFYSPNWRRLSFGQKYNFAPSIDAPDNLTEMLVAAAQLAKGFRHIRVDFYSDGDQFYVGELTFCHESACGIFRPKNADRKLAKLFTDPYAEVDDLKL